MLGTYYADRFVGRKTANGEIFRQNQYTAAHKTIPFGTFLKVYNPYSGLEIVVRVNDRCPVKNVLDMTKIAVLKLGIKGSRKVQVVTLDPDEGYALWVQQDTLDMTHEEYMAFKDRSPVRRMTPYASGGSPSRGTPPQEPAGTPTAVKPQPAAPVADTLPTPVAEPVEEPAAKVTATALVPEPEAPSLLAELPVAKQVKLYDLVICTPGSRQSAQRAILRLPRDLQTRATIEDIPHTRQVRVVLGLANTRSHVIRVQAMLIEDFPDSFLMPHYDREKSPSE